MDDNSTEADTLQQLAKRGVGAWIKIILAISATVATGGTGLFSIVEYRLDALEQAISGISDNAYISRNNKAEIQRLWDRIGSVEKSCNDHLGDCRSEIDKLEKRSDRLEWRIQRYHDGSINNGH